MLTRQDSLSIRVGELEAELEAALEEAMRLRTEAAAAAKDSRAAGEEGGRLQQARDLAQQQAQAAQQEANRLRRALEVGERKQVGGFLLHDSAPHAAPKRPLVPGCSACKMLPI